MSLAKFFAAAKKLPFDERVELAHRLWDDFMDGLQGWKAPRMPRGVFAWKTLKLKIDSKLSRSDRIELAQQVWGNIQENGYDPDPTPEQIEELERRAEELAKHPERGIPWEQMRAELKERLAQRRK
ncbi:MAG TPA: addiction module protein [Verrucomicrobiae bacterium]|jgi:putative addiction module component (TIGR02574 family)|nr:addiction module protein [Verrucomicrobiae bacterium]